jgi:peroxiredoxin
VPKHNKGLKQGESVPSFVLPDPDGVEYNSNELFKEQTLLYFMRGTW